MGWRRGEPWVAELRVGWRLGSRDSSSRDTVCKGLGVSLPKELQGLKGHKAALWGLPEWVGWLHKESSHETIPIQLPRHDEDGKAQQRHRPGKARKQHQSRELRTLDAGNDTGSYEKIFILRSWSGQALNLLESSRISSEVTCPGLPRDVPPTGGRLADVVALSGAISSIVDLNRTAGCAWASRRSFASRFEPTSNAPANVSQESLRSPQSGWLNQDSCDLRGGRSEGHRFFSGCLTFFVKLLVLGIRRHVVTVDRIKAAVYD